MPECSNQKRKEKEICLFLRRVCLAEYFLLGHISSAQSIVDLTSPDYISKRYGVHFTSPIFIFKEFIFSNLPKEFIHLVKQPFNIPIDQNIMSFYSVLEYNYLIKFFDDFDDTNEDSSSAFDRNEMEAKKNIWALKNVSIYFTKFMKSFYGHHLYPSVLLVTLACASKMMIVDQSYLASFDSIYTDKFGCPDENCERNQPLYLNDEMYKKFMDFVLCGDFSLHFKPNNKEFII